MWVKTPGHTSHEKNSLAIDMDDVRCETMQNEQAIKLLKKSAAHA